MGKINKKVHSIKWSFLLYVSFCLVIAFVGSMAVGVSTNYLQDWYRSTYPDAIAPPTERYEIIYDDGGYPRVGYIRDDSFIEKTLKKESVIYWFISYSQVIIIPVWFILCFIATGTIFYNRELKRPIEVLMNAANKISENQLDFKVEYHKKNELGKLCDAFEEMRSALYKSNQEMWQSLEERKRLNAAFSHDLRTPLTVLKGYGDFLEMYVPDKKVSEEKLLSVIAMMNGQITRLEHYTQKMNAVQKIEDIVPKINSVSSDELIQTLKETGELVCGDKFSINDGITKKEIYIDRELVLQVYENLISNALRYGENSVKVTCRICDDLLYLSVSDDGRGFSKEALKNAAQPFFRDENEPDKIHFGLGLYICRILCEKCGGELLIENEQGGGKVTAAFCCKKISENR
ncbi:MAG: HAMP domain-containing histidine kinase [Lachnospiraceae bacterium]|nr:HAMP domain-containing histidine kinase [Lachnospiraceae bacterium]